MCAVNLVPGVTFAEGSRPDPEGEIWVLLLRGPSAFDLGDGRGVMARQNDSVVTATWNGAETGDRSLRFVAGGATEAAVVAISREIAGRAPTLTAAAP